MSLGKMSIDESEGFGVYGSGGGGDLFFGGVRGPGYAWGVTGASVFQQYEAPTQYSPDPEAPLTAQPVPPAQPMVPRSQDAGKPTTLATQATTPVQTAAPATTSLPGWVIPVAIVIAALVLIKK